MDTEEATNNSNPISSETYKEVDSELHHRQIRERWHRGVFLGALSSVLVAVLLYFTLPTFQAYSMEIKGLYDLEKEDILSLGLIGQHHSYLFMDADDFSKKVETNANGLLSQVKTEVNMFDGSMSLKENHPIASYQGVSYFTSGKTLDEVALLLSQSGLSSLRQDELLKLYREQCSGDELIDIHLPEGITLSNDTYRSQAFSPLYDIPKEAKGVIRAIQYVNKDGNTTFNRTSDIIIHDAAHNCNYVLQNALYDQFSHYFNPDSFPSAVLDSCYDKAVRRKMEAKTYTYLDGGSVENTYLFAIHYDAGTNGVSIYVPEA